MPKDVRSASPRRGARQCRCRSAVLVEQLWRWRRPGRRRTPTTPRSSGSSRSGRASTGRRSPADAWLRRLAPTGAAARRATRSPRSATARCARRKSELFHRYETYGEPDADVEMAYYFWLLRAAAGTDPRRHRLRPRVGARRGRTCLGAPLEALAALGVAPDAVLDPRRHPPPLRPHRQPRRLPGGGDRRPAPGARVLDRSARRRSPVRLPRRGGTRSSGSRGATLGTGAADGGQGGDPEGSPRSTSAATRPASS